MKTFSTYCLTCQKHTEHTYLVERYGTQCTLCRGVASQLDKLELESHSYTTPDGEQGIVVDNTPQKVVFYVEKGLYAGYYVYDKATGFGAIQSHVVE